MRELSFDELTSISGGDWSWSDFTAATLGGVATGAGLGAFAEGVGAVPGGIIGGIIGAAGYAFDAYTGW
ncbi:hypothetical protein DNHGIG_39480 [Collibacillus ludicampi]|uniref:Bacteriocin n=1 Tax=Collibacillus ludicampi TaxID=2771369 RepID=A0AAV4LMH0_9BACL|nr:Blp family class II bacteriocin [Collibacillus ludicampi]GIM48399.1 hypothetical protein DNHGIG_39480 [Collibacillus ludicampi]